MNQDNPYIKLFKTPGGFYIYDVNKNVILRIPESVYKLIRKEKTEAAEKTDNNILEKMLADGFMSSNRVKELIHPASDLLNYYLENKMRMLTLQVTQQCNLRCEYCTYSGSYLNRKHSGKRMSLDTAKAAIDLLIAHSKDSKSVHIGFYGGEPLLEFELVKKCMAYALEAGEGKTITFGMTTNGTLLNEDIISHFEKHQLDLRISLDGPKAIHDKNRKFACDNSGTFDKVITNLEFIKKSFPEYLKKKISFNAVIDTENDFKCNSDFFTDYETLKESNLSTAYVSDRYRKDNIQFQEDFVMKRNYEIFKYFLFKLGKLDEKYTSKLIRDYYTNITKTKQQLKPMNGLPEKAHHGGPCIPGVLRLFVNVNGDFYPCERVSESSSITKIGNISDGFDTEQIKRILNIGKISEEYCKNCWAFRHCSSCVSTADSMDSLSVELKLSYCNSIRNSLEDTFKDYCTLKEYGCNTQDEGRVLEYT